MSIRTKLIGAFLLMAALVPVVGILASRAGAIDDDGATDGDAALAVVIDLAESQRAQQADVLLYLTGGAVEARQHYIDRSLPFQGALAELAAVLPDGERDGAIAAITLRREQFGTAAEQILDARAAMDRNLAEIRAAQREILPEVNAIRSRYVGPGADLSGVPAGQRAQVADLLRGVEGMLQAVDLQMALAAAYTIQQQDATRQQLEATTTAFNAWLRLANASAGAEDRPILARVESTFTTRLTPSAESLLAAADAAALARPALTETSDGIIAGLNDLSAQAAGVAVAGDDSGFGRTETLTLAGTLLAFLLALGLGFWFAGSITRPLRQLRNAAEKISTGDLDNVTIDVDAKDEVGDLANAFRRMVTSIRFLMLDKAERDAEDRDFMSSSISL